MQAATAACIVSSSGGPIDRLPSFFRTDASKREALFVRLALSVAPDQAMEAGNVPTSAAGLPRPKARCSSVSREWQSFRLAAQTAFRVTVAPQSELD
ncbi:hypothetical protein [Roseivivax marinus]|uniref:hypothetical protein n=1 Tax=Roseivivax marinus TaxID=1379903 RepID=UPI001969F368|nr:hypothetical protein [Roseivivax marinus]